MSLSICLGCVQHCLWERLVGDYQLCSLLFGLKVVFVRPGWVPSLALLATLCMVHFALVIFPIACHTNICQERNQGILFYTTVVQATTTYYCSNTDWMLEHLSYFRNPVGGSYPLNTEVCHTPQILRWGLWCSTTDHQDHCWDSCRSSPSGLALGTYQDKTYRRADRHYWKC